MTSPTALLGRESTVAGAVASIEERGVRRLLVSGRSGVGKTAVARAIADRIDRISVIVPVDEAGDAQEVLVRLGRAVGATEAGRGIRAAVTYALGRRPTVLVLDGCEAWDALGPVVDELLDRCDDLVVLMTARYPSGVADEAVIHLRPLEVPGPEEVDEAALRQNAGIRLFVERAQQLSVAFEPAASDLRAIADLCRRLDGLPLAIKLAASRIQLMEPQAMLREMGRIGSWQLVGLSLDDELASSVERLDESAHRTFAALDTFVGGTSVDALHSVTDLPQLRDTIDALAVLVDLGLVVVDSARARYSLSSAASTFARHRPDVHGDRHDLRARHAAYFARSARQRARTGSDAAADQDLAIDHGNRLAAVSWLRLGGSQDRALRLLVDIAPDFDRRGEPESGRQLLVGALAAAPDATARTKAECHLWLARFLAESADPGDRPRAIEHLNTARTLADESGHQPTIFVVLNTICENHTLLGSFGLARQAVDEGIARSQDGKHPYAEVGYLTWRAVITHQAGDEAGAATEIETAIGKAMALGERRLIVRTCLVLLGLPAAVRAGVAPDSPSPQQLVEMARADGDHRGEGWLLALVTGTAIDEGDLLRGAASCRNLLRLSLRTANAPLGRLALGAAVRLAAAKGDPELAARLAGALDRHAGAVEASMPPHTYSSLREAISFVENLLGPTAYQHAHERGRLARWYDLTASVDVFLTGLVESSDRTGDDAAPSTSCLSPRELDVLAELVTGRSNKEIAATLGLRPKTVMHHCASIYRKLDVSGRSAAVAVALRTGVIAH